jgi:anti-sigma28 factor (negative regulator of flagellin synthesis)
MTEEIEGQEEVAAQPDNGEQLILGKFKSSDDLAKSYTELEKKLGEQGARTKHLTDLLLQSQKSAKPEPAVQGPTYEQQIGEIQQRIENGEISVSEGVVMSNNLTAEYAAKRATERMDKTLREREVQKERESFLESNPDFEELRQSGVLDKVKRNMPNLHDDFSAYYALKAEQNRLAVEAARKQGIELGKTEAARIAEGDRRTKKVLQKPGVSAAEIGRPEGKANPSDIKKSMLEALMTHNAS